MHRLALPLPRGPLHCLTHLVETEGWRGLARGTTGTLAREVPGNALFFTVYEVCYSKLWSSIKTLNPAREVRQGARLHGQ